MESVSRRICSVGGWRAGSALAALASGALLPLRPAARLSGVAVALCIAVAAELGLRRFLRRCALRPELAAIPAVERTRRRLCSERRRRAAVSALRATASASPLERTNPLVLWDRVSLVGDDLSALADELETARDVDPRTMLELDRLLCDGRHSPLLNPRISPGETPDRVRWIRLRLHAQDG